MPGECKHLDQVKITTTDKRRLRRLHQDRRHLGAFADVHGLRTRSLLRLFQEQARHQTFSLTNIIR